MTTKPTCETCQAWRVYLNVKDDPEEGGPAYCCLTPERHLKGEDDWCIQHIPIEREHENTFPALHAGKWVAECAKCGNKMQIEKPDPAIVECGVPDEIEMRADPATCDHKCMWWWNGITNECVKCGNAMGVEPELHPPHSQEVSPPDMPHPSEIFADHPNPTQVEKNTETVACDHEFLCCGDEVGFECVKCGFRKPTITLSADKFHDLGLKIVPGDLVDSIQVSDDHLPEHKLKDAYEKLGVANERIKDLEKRPSLHYVERCLLEKNARIKELETFLDNGNQELKDLQRNIESYHVTLDEVDVTLDSVVDRIKRLAASRDGIRSQLATAVDAMKQVNDSLTSGYDWVKGSNGLPEMHAREQSATRILQTALLSIEGQLPTPAQSESEDVPQRKTYSSTFPKETTDD